MSVRIRSRQKARRKTFIREWREFRELTQERVVGRLEDADVDLSVAQYSRIENGVSPYTQDTLEAIADALQTDAASLLMRNPQDDDAIWSIWDQAKPGQRRQIKEVVKAIVKTGT